MSGQAEIFSCKNVFATVKITELLIVMRPLYNSCIIIGMTVVVVVALVAVVIVFTTSFRSVH